jgi:benzoyl-CoA reductase subunit B
MSALYKTRPLKCWNKAKEMRDSFYRRYATIKDQGGIRWAGSAWSFDVLTKGLGDDVANLTSEPYGASIAASNPRFAVNCFEACEAHGYARDLCAYMRAYWGSVFLDKYVYGGPFPKPDFALTTGICCSHCKWYQVVSEWENIPYFGIDIGTAAGKENLKQHHIDYVANQSLEAIEWMEKVTGRKFDDEKFIQAVLNEFRTTSLWAEICYLNQAVPAPLDEKSMFTLYVHTTLDKTSKEVVDFYEEVLAEVKERIAEGIAAVPIERSRIISDSQPPWSFLKLFRYLEEYGAVSIGSYYTYCLTANWDFERQPDGHIKLTPAITPQKKGITIKTREEAARVYAEWNQSKIIYINFADMHFKTDVLISMVKDWKADGVILQFNRGCEGTTLGVPENRLGLLKAGIPVVAYEGNMGDAREFDEGSTLARIDSFMESMNYKKSN